MISSDEAKLIQEVITLIKNNYRIFLSNGSISNIKYYFRINKECFQKFIDFIEMNLKISSN